MKKLLRRLLPPLFTLAILAALLWYGDAPKVIATVEHFKIIYLLWYVCLLLAHEITRGSLWLFLLRALGIRAPLRLRIFAFAAADAVKVIPGGAYLENYLLQRSAGSDFGRSSAATTVMIVAEIVVALAGVIALGLGAWSTWLRPALGVMVVVICLLGVLFLTSPHHSAIPRRIREHRLLLRALDVFKRFRAGSEALMHPRTIAITLLLCALYVFLASVNLYIVTRALSIGGIGFRETISVYCFGLAFYVVLGSVEAAGVAAFIGSGVSRTAAVSAILINRALDICTTIVLAAIVVLALRDHGRGARQQATERNAARDS